MNDTSISTEGHDEPGRYEIRVQGHLDNRWADWFVGMTIQREDSGNTLLAGQVVDQAALHGLLRKVRDLGMPLLSVVQVEPPSAADDNANTDQNHSNKETNT